MTSDAMEQHTDVAEERSVGAMLKAAREKAGLTPEQVGAQLKLSHHQIEALDADDFANLPGRTFVRGFVRNYARLVGLDPEVLMQMLDKALPRPQPGTIKPQLEGFSALDATYEQGGHHGALLWFVVFLGLLIGGGVVFWMIQKPIEPALEVTSMPINNAAPDVMAPVAVASEPTVLVASREASASSVAVASHTAAASAVVASRSAVVPISAPVTSPAPMTTSAPAVAVASVTQKASVVVDANAIRSGVRIVASKESWVQVTDANGRRLQSGLLSAGSDQAWAGQAPYQVKVGNALNAKVYYRGQPVDLQPYLHGGDVATLELK